MSSQTYISSSFIAVETSSTLPHLPSSTSTLSSQSLSSASPSSPASTSSSSSYSSLASTSSSSPEPTSTSTSKTHSPRVAAIAGAVVGVIVVMTLVAIWAFLRRRKSHPSKTSPSISPKGRDLEQQLNLYYNDNNNNNNNKEDSSSGNTPKHSFYSLRKNNSHASKKSNVTNTQATTPTPAVPLARDPTQPRSHSVHNITITPTSTHKQAHRRQLSVPTATIILPSDTPPVPPVPLIPSDTAKIERKSTVAKPLVQECQQPIDCHIDMVNVDVESLMPIIMTDELELQQPNNIPIQSQQLTSQKQTPKQQDQQDQQQNVNNNAKDSNIPPAPIVLSTPTMPTPTPRPPLAGRKSTDGGRNRISMSFLPPTPPPNVPPPAVPMTYPGGITEASRTSAEASTHAIITRGRKPRASVDSISSAGRRSISLDSSHREGHAQEMTARSKANNSPSGGYAHRTSKKIILPPSTPPPVSAMSKLQQQQKQVPMHARRQHQRNPSQILSTGFFASPDRSPLSPLSPPHSPLTIQIPRNMPPRSNSALATYATPTIQNRPDSPTIGSNNPSPSQFVQFQQQQLPSAMKTKAQSQNKRIRSKSVTQTEHHRVIIPSSASGHCVGPRSPAHLSDHLPPFPPVHSHLLHIRRPSQPQQQQQWLLNQQALSNGWEESSRPSTSTPTASASASLSTARDDEEREHELQQQRPASFDSWTQQSYPASPATPTAPESLTGSENHYSVIRGSIEKDLELQAIIANARRIAAEKIAAMEEARRLSYISNSSNRHQQQQFHYHQGQRFARPTSSVSSSRPRTPSDENWDASRPSYDDGFESEASSYISTTKSARATPSPSHG